MNKRTAWSAACIAAWFVYVACVVAFAEPGQGVSLLRNAEISAADRALHVALTQGTRAHERSALVKPKYERSARCP